MIKRLAYKARCLFLLLRFNQFAEGKWFFLEGDPQQGLKGRHLCFASVEAENKLVPNIVPTPSTEVKVISI